MRTISTRLSWSDQIRRSGTPGTLLKAFDGEYYYKASTYRQDVGFVGTESFNEVIVSFLCDMLGVPCVRYELAEASIETVSGIYDTYVCCSKDYKSGTTTLPFEEYIEKNLHLGETVVECSKRLGYWEYIKQMIFIDYVVINRDRHGANIEVYETGNLVPLFDNGLSLVAPYTDDINSIKIFDVLYPWRANNYVGSKSLEENLLLMLTDRVKVSKLDEESLYNFLLELPLNEVIRDKIYEIVTRRFSYAYNICAL